MDVTNFNFLELLPEIVAAIEKCDFIAIDTELSGLMRERSNNKFDSPAERFVKAVQSSRGYFIMQFGLSCFTRVEGLQYSSRTYNFYIFPQENEGLGDVDRTLSLQVHAIQFLSGCNFDFNKLFKHGVSYLTFYERKQMTSKLKSDMKARSKPQIAANGLPSFVPHNWFDFCKKKLKEIEKFVQAQAKLASASVATSPEGDGSGNVERSTGDDTTKSDNVLELRDCTAGHKRNVMRRLIECQPFYDELIVSNSAAHNKNESYLVVKYVGKSAKADLEKKALLSAKGFLEVIECIIEHKKPFVGHNLYLDLIQLINQFIEPLSDSYDEFKEICHSLFPLIYDTKFLAHRVLQKDSLSNNQSRLHDLYCYLKNRDDLVKIKVDHQNQFPEGTDLPHQAGYDAYMSGYCFVVLGETHVRRRSEARKENVLIAEEEVVVEDLSNRLHLSFSHDYKCFQLTADEDEPPRLHVFYLEFPKTWTLDDIYQVFQMYKGADVCKLSQTSALCALKEVQHVPAVITKAKKLREGATSYRIYTYEEYIDKFKPKTSKGPGEDAEDEDVEFACVD